MMAEAKKTIRLVSSKGARKSKLLKMASGNLETVDKLIALAKKLAEQGKLNEAQELLTVVDGMLKDTKEYQQWASDILSVLE